MVFLLFVLVLTVHILFVKVILKVIGHIHDQVYQNQYGNQKGFTFLTIFFAYSTFFLTC